MFLAAIFPSIQLNPAGTVDDQKQPVLCTILLLTL